PISTAVAIATLFFFFFFQAEDGIRDFHVTGVQTCALPIFEVVGRRLVAEYPPGQVEGGAVAWAVEAAFPIGRQAGLRAGREGRRESEERRVGKEWRTRGSRQ